MHSSDTCVLLPFRQEIPTWKSVWKCLLTSNYIPPINIYQTAFKSSKQMEFPWVHLMPASNFSLQCLWDHGQRLSPSFRRQQKSLLNTLWTLWFHFQFFKRIWKLNIKKPIKENNVTPESSLTFSQKIKIDSSYGIKDISNPWKDPYRSSFVLERKLHKHSTQNERSKQPLRLPVLVN